MTDDCWAKGLIKLGSTELRRPKVCRRSTSVLFLLLLHNLAWNLDEIFHIHYQNDIRSRHVLTRRPVCRMRLAMFKYDKLTIVKPKRTQPHNLPYGSSSQNRANPPPPPPPPPTHTHTHTQIIFGYHNCHCKNTMPITTVRICRARNIKIRNVLMLWMYVILYIYVST